VGCKLGLRLQEPHSVWTSLIPFDWDIIYTKRGPLWSQSSKLLNARHQTPSLMHTSRTSPKLLANLLKTYSLLWLSQLQRVLHPAYLPYSNLTALEFCSEKSKILEVKVVESQRSGKRGRPRKIVSDSFLREVFKPGRNITISRIATTLGVHRNSIKNYMKLYKIVRQPFSTTVDSQLDSMIKRFKDSHPNTGIRYIRGFLLQQGLRVQRSRIIASLSRVDDVAKVVLRNKTIKRREYKSARPNALWHLDGHHKLGLWGIVIHGITDGFDRVVRAVHSEPHQYLLTPRPDYQNEGVNK
jgi:hypothetical protein